MHVFQMILHICLLLHVTDKYLFVLRIRNNLIPHWRFYYRLHSFEREKMRCKFTFTKMDKRFICFCFIISRTINLLGLWIPAFTYSLQSGEGLVANNDHVLFVTIVPAPICPWIKPSAISSSSAVITVLRFTWNNFANCRWLGILLPIGHSPFSIFLSYSLLSADIWALFIGRHIKNSFVYLKDSKWLVFPINNWLKTLYQLLNMMKRNNW